MTAPTSSDLALVLSGGGARAAYQVGVLAALGERLPELVIPVVTGVSAGAINAAYLAGHPRGLRAAIDGLSNQWARLTSDQVYRIRPADTVRWVGKSVAHLLYRGRNGAAMVRGLFDMQPLTAFLERGIISRGLSRTSGAALSGPWR